MGWNSLSGVTPQDVVIASEKADDAIDLIIEAIHSRKPRAARKAANIAVSHVLQRKGKKSIRERDVEAIRTLVAEILEHTVRVWRIVFYSEVKVLSARRRESVAQSGERDGYSIGRGKGSSVAFRPEPSQSLTAPIGYGKRHPLADPLPAPYKAPPLQAKQIAVNGPFRSKTRHG